MIDSLPNRGRGRPSNAEREARQTDDPKEFLIRVMKNPKADLKYRIDAAKTLLPYVHVKVDHEPQGKKARAQAAAMVAGEGTEWGALLQ